MNIRAMLHGISRALWDSDLIASRVSLSIAEFMWAVMLLWPGDTFGRPTYTAMAYVMHEGAWGLILLLSAATQITIVMMETYHNYFSRLFAAWNACLWVFLVVSMMLSVSPPPAAIGGEVALALAAVWIWVRPLFLVEGYRRAFKSTDRARL